jgi:hypothetical protein
MLKALNAHQDNFTIIEDVENIDHFHEYILKLYDENFSSHFPIHLNIPLQEQVCARANVCLVNNDLDVPDSVILVLTPPQQNMTIRFNAANELTNFILILRGFLKLR